jgi:hypothetical protein
MHYFVEAKVTEKGVISIFRVEDGHSMPLRKIGFYQPVHTAP